MKTKNIYLIRHGETPSNLEQTWRTAAEDLTDKGIEQAKKVAERVKSLDIGYMVASTSKRTLHTAKIISEVTGLECNGDKLFYEEKSPTSIQGLVHEKISENKIEQYIQLLLDNSEDPDYHYEDEENLHDRKVRVGYMLKYLENADAENILVVSHGNILKMLATYILLGPECTSKELYLVSQRLKTANTGITQIICDKGIWRILIWNDHAHFAE